MRRGTPPEDWQWELPRPRKQERAEAVVAHA
jgi:hypothetical protein